MRKKNRSTSGIRRSNLTPYRTTSLRLRSFFRICAQFLENFAQHQENFAQLRKTSLRFCSTLKNFAQTSINFEKLPRASFACRGPGGSLTAPGRLPRVCPTFSEISIANSRGHFHFVEVERGVAFSISKISRTDVKVFSSSFYILRNSNDLVKVLCAFFGSPQTRKSKFQTLIFHFLQILTWISKFLQFSTTSSTDVKVFGQ